MANNDNIFNLKVRRNIFQLLQKHPGLHFREISRQLDIRRSTLSYHLRYLEKKGVIKKIAENGFTRYYIAEDIADEKKTMLHLLRQEVPRNIILYMLSNTCASRIELSKKLDKHPTTIEHHLKKLINKDVIELIPREKDGVYVKFGDPIDVKRTRVSKEKFYRLRNPFSIYDSIIIYEKNL